MDWSPDIEKVLRNVEANATTLSRQHHDNHNRLKSFIKYFQIPLIILNSVNSVVAIGSIANARYINCGISTACVIISSVAMYLKLEIKLTEELELGKAFYNLALDIEKTLSLKPESRHITGESFLQFKFALYTKLIERSNIWREFKDKLVRIDSVDAMVPATKKRASIYDII